MRRNVFKMASMKFWPALLLVACLLSVGLVSVSLVSIGNGQGRYGSRQMQQDNRPRELRDYRIPNWKKPTIDEARARQLGIRKLKGKYITLYTDLPSDPSIDNLPALFDQAFPQWCEFLGIRPGAAKKVHLTGSLMTKRKPFEEVGLLPKAVPDFAHGFAFKDWFWLYDQDSGYYRRHLVFHEGVHSLMNTVFGSCGPPWYMESTAEYLGTHRLDKNGKVTVGVVPENREAVPMWGRTKLIRDAIRAGRHRTLDEMFRLASYEFSNNETYAWSWALAVLLDQSPKTQKIYRGLAKHVSHPDFNQRAKRVFKSQWRDIERQWLIMADSIDYGYDVVRNEVDMKRRARRLGKKGAKVEVAADHGWQNSGIRVEVGKTYHLVAKGRYRIVKGKGGSPDWMAEPGGVAIRYHGGRPLGIVQAAVLPARADKTFPLFKPVDVGLEATFTPKQSGVLLLRINDHPGELAENQGKATVAIEEK